MAALCDCRSFIFAWLSGRQDYGFEPSHFLRALSLDSYLLDEEKSKIQYGHRECSDYWYKMATLALGTVSQNEWVPVAASHSRYVLDNRVCSEKGTLGNLVVMWTLCKDYSDITGSYTIETLSALPSVLHWNEKWLFFLSTCLYEYLFHL